MAFENCKDFVKYQKHTILTKIIRTKKSYGKPTIIKYVYF